MGDNNYEISLGIDLDTSGLKEQINKIDGKYDVKLGVDLKVNDIRDRITQYNKNTNNAKLKLGIKLDTDDLKKQINSLNLSGKNNKDIAIPVNTESLETSLKEVKGIIADIKNSIGTLDSGTEMKSLLSSINQISSALDKASGKFEELVSDLKILSSKDFNINLGINAGGSNNPIARNAAYGNKVRNETLPQLKQQAEALENYLKEYYKVADGFNAAQKLLQGTGAGNGKASLYDLLPKMLDSSNSLSTQMSVWKEYIGLIKEAADIKGIDLSSVTYQFSKQSEELVKDAQDIQTGAKEAKDGLEQLKQVFGGGLNLEGLSDALDPIVQDLKVIRESIDGLSKGISIEGLTNSFNRMSDVLDNLSVNLASIYEHFESIRNISSNTGNNISNSINQANQQAKRLISDSAQESIKNVSSTGINKYFAVTKDDSDDFRREMDNLVRQWTNGKGNLVDLKIDTRTFYDKDVGENVERLHQAQVTYNNALGETIKKTIAWRKIDEEQTGTKYNKKTKKSEPVYQNIYGFSEVASQYSKTLGQTKTQTDNFVKQQKTSIANLTNQINQLNRAANDQNAARPIKEQQHLTSLADKYDEITNAIQRMENASSDTFVDEQNNVKRLISEFKSLVSEYKNAENVSTKMKGTDFASGLDIAKNDLEKFKAEAKDFPKITATVNELDSAIKNVGDSASLNKFNDQLRVARSELSKIKTETAAVNRSEKVGINVSGLESKIADLQRISPEIDKFEAEIDGAKVSVHSLLEDLKNVNTQSDFSVVNSKWRAFKEAASAAEIAVTEVVKKTKSIKDIKLDIELGSYDNQISQMDDNFSKLSSASRELYDSIEQVHKAYRHMELALEGTDDEVADKEMLIQAEKEYAAALEKTNNLIRIKAREESKNARKDKLENDIKLFKADIDNWLINNSAATKRFGDSMLELRAKAEGVDRVKLNGLIQQFKLIDKAADNAGLKIQSFGDRIKTKAKEYMAYFSVAEIFMEVTQALRKMFETVVEIDTAMTGLYRVTDLTVSQYDVLFDNMISSAKEYGATLNDIINATTDWVRAGFDADTALGLAEVTTMYQHISDLDYDTAAENLITAYNGFKDELNGTFDGDTVSAVNYIADIFNELDNNFAVTSAGLGEALTRSASALDLAGNSIQETAGMITGIVEVTQDPEKAGSALKVLSLRLRGMKGQLEELGEETDENVENISKMQGQILNMTGGKVNIFDASGNFKSTYEIMKGIAEVWDNLSSIDQANLLETIAGKNRANDVASLLSNWKHVEDAVKSANEAEGSAARENAKYVDSLQGRLDKLTTAWQSFSETFMKSDFLKGGVSALTTFVELIEKIVDTLGTSGTIGLGIGIWGLFKNKEMVSNIVNFGKALFDSSISFDDFDNAATSAGKSFKSFLKSASGIATVASLVVAGIGLIYNAVKNYKEEISKARQETIQSSNEFLDAASSFEQAYIKYSGKTELTSEEEDELASAIKGTVDALDDKSSALQGIVNSSNDYLKSLERIKNAELEAAKSQAKAKRDNAKSELEDTAMGWARWDGSEVNIALPTDSDIFNAADKINSKFLHHEKYTTDEGIVVESMEFRLANNADADEIVEYYDTLLKFQESLSDNELVDTTTYNNVSSAIEKLSESVKVYVEGVYEAEKAEYQWRNGIPKTVENYLKMREAIIGNMSDKSLDTRISIANQLDSEYGQIFDLSSVEAQARKFVGLIQDYGNNEISTVETYLNMRTAVNNNDCTVGQYLDEFNKVNDLTQGWNEEEKELFNSSFGLDVDSIKQQYDDIVNYLLKKVNTSGMGTDQANLTGRVAKAEIKEFLNSLTADELSAVISLKTEIDWENVTSEDILNQIEERVKFNKAMNFTIAINVEAESIESLNTALSESKSATGLAAESIAALKDRYKDLDNYNVDALFEETANGIRINSTELSKLEKEYKDLNKQEIDETLLTLKNEYDKLTDEIGNCTNDQAKLNDLYSERDNILDQIKNVASLAAQYDGLTSAYNDWQRAQEAGQDRDPYENIISGREEIKDEMSRGWLDDAAVEYLELLSGKDLSTAGIDNQIAAYEELSNTIGNSGYSIWDFFTEDEDGNSTSDGVYNFFDTVKSVAGETAAWIDENGAYHFDFEGFEHNGKTGDAAIAEILGTSEELVQIILRAAEDAGFVINIEGDYTDLADTTDDIYNLNEQLKSIGATDYTFNVKATDLNYINEQIAEAQSALQYFENRDGKINLDDSDVRAAASILATLVFRKSDLENPTLMSIDVSEPTTKLEEVLGLAQQLKDAKANLEIQTEIGADTTAAQAEIDTLLSKISSDNYADITASLNVDATSVDSAIASINAISSEQVVSLGLDTSKIDGYVADDKDATVTYEKDSTEVDEYDPPDFTRTVTFNVNSYSVDNYNPSNLTRTLTYEIKIVGGIPEVNGTANANGTAFANGSIGEGKAFKHGDWGIEDSGAALMGELGREIIVRDGKWFTVGDSGAGFYNYKKGDIIFNHKQTEELFKNGKVTSGGGRGKSFANGSAFAKGSLIGSNGSGSARNAIASYIKEATETITEAIEKTSNERTENLNSNNGSNGNSGLNARDSIKNAATTTPSGSTTTENKFEEVIDWIEIILDRVERSIDRLDKKANNSFKNWSIRNSALVSEIGEVGKEIGLQNQAKNTYIAKANSVGLPESYASKVRNGTLSIEDFEGESDEKLVEKIKDYQEWYEKALDCQDAIDDLREKESELYKQRFDNVASEYEGILSIVEHEKNMLEEYISQSETQAWLVSSKYYDALANNEQENISKLKEEKAALLSSLNSAMSSGTIDRYSEAWYEMVNAVDEVTLAITEGETALLEYQQTLQQLDWEVFDILQERISNVTEEADFLIELMSNSKLYEDNGQLTDNGKATMGLHGQNYNVYMHQADEYRKEVEELNKELEKDPYDQDLINRRDELLGLQRDSILAAEDEKNAIRDMVEEGIEYELDALQELIDKKNEELDSVKDLYDYNKKVKEQTKEIASLEKQMAAYSGDDSEEAKAKIQELKVSLEEAKTDLEETEYDKYISDTQKILDDLYLEYETILNERLDNLDGLISDMILEINANAGIISETINTSADSVGYTLTESMNTIWSGANNVITTYGEKFSQAQTTTNNALNTINANLQNMISYLNKDANANIESASTSSAAHSSEANYSSEPTPAPTPVSDPAPTQADYTGVALAIINGNHDWGNGTERAQKLAEAGFDAAQVQGLVNELWDDNSVHSGGWQNKYGVGDLSQYSYKNYKTGISNINKDQLAWTQEGRKQEFIVRPSDGAILTPLAKSDSVLNAAASDNIWKMANSPSEFIRDNLNLGVSNVPNNSNVNNNYVQNLDNVVFSFPNVQNYNELLSSMQKDKNFEKLILSMSIDRIAGGSSLAKGKILR